MFPYSQRLHSSDDIVKVLRHGARSRCGYVTLHYLPNRHTDARVAVVVDKKVSKKAVVRNLWKRRARSILEATHLPAVDLVVRLYSPIESTDFTVLKSHIESCLEKIRTTRSSL